ncbi:Cysteine desulfurase [Ferroglobus placidus DSM 10642]|uniref:Cysteine desulfurase n=1 Tax=Ferroglobus placidus (strain DSM 10642 / AEDII12DO) TaxID=589924 RepID=D3RXR8_FERPA|nr:cysteine desulfurase family protein [Ferroglobus placidus]ADC65281.1 Cysteine desulfurase [Ferroglobus placidus DSM 10642]
MPYMDYVSGCPVDERVIEAMLPYFKHPGNPSSIHSVGLEARNAMEEARGKVASLINADSSEIVFTSGATESNNLAIIGYATRNKSKGKHIIVSAIEHISVINCAKFLQKNGFEVDYAPVDSYGKVKLDELENLVREDTILVSIQHANPEIGTIQDIEKIRDAIKDVTLHVDATASLGKIEVNVEKLGADMLTISSNDIYGPRGVGALYIRKGVRVNPVILGGGQERGLRGGTENVAAIVGFGRAAEITMEEWKSEAERLKKMRDRLIEGLLKIEDTFLNGHPTERLPNNASVRFSYIEGESIILSLDMEGIQASTGSACTSKTLQPSHVLMAIGLKHEEAHGSVVFSLGRWNKEEDVDYVLEKLPPIIERLRMMSPLYLKKKKGGG